MMIAADQSRRCSYLPIGIHAIFGFSYTVGVYISHALSTNVRKLPLKMEFSFDPTVSPFFECILAGQFFYLLTAASIVGTINALLACLVLYSGGQIDIIKRNMMQMSVNNNYKGSLAAIRKLVFKHRKIIALSDNIFTAIALMQLLWNSFIICSSDVMIAIVMKASASYVSVLLAMY